ncbi:GGDEF domain-containing protein [Vibrio salinus]|uniref:GGDEF domain-containing protein n=1 Tax=Vibrio salinus TaxID=2899784 RepID=UPI001E30CB3F|nr:GGDEF domain-containing protein [Vibrio salinus]MCE0496072.1 GGDEF domain-containing protein [Vibrio salinus]
MLTYPTKVSSSSSNMELKCLAITLAIIFFFNTPVSYIKNDQLKDYQQQLLLRSEIISEKIRLINSLIKHHSDYGFSVFNKGFKENFNYIKSIEYKPSYQISHKCGSHFPSTVKTNTLFDPNTDEFRIYQPICHQSKTIRQLYINLDLKALCDFSTPNLILLNADSYIYNTSSSNIYPGHKLSEIYPKIWNEISVMDKPNNTFSIKDTTVIVHKLSFISDQPVFVLHIIDDSDLIPPYFYIIIFMFGITAGVTYYLYLLRKEKMALSKITYTDQLSGLNNRHYLSKIKNRITTDGNYYLCILDIDHFKKVNDKYGHDIGDQVIRRVATVIKSKIRFSDYAIRFGGEEFLVILKTNSKEDAANIIERIRAGVEQLAQQPSVSISGGLCCLNQPMESTIKCADAQLYKAKESGRNLIVC